MSVRVVRLELADRLAVQLESLQVTRHDELRVLVTSHDVPLGWLHVANEPRALENDTLVASLAEQLGADIWASIAMPRTAQAVEAPQPAIDVVVCTRERPDDLARCLAALADQRYVDYRVIVVDNAPSESPTTRSVAERFGAVYVVEPRRGLDHARNRGLAAVEAAIVAYTDDDVVPHPGWLAGIARGFFSDEVHCVTGLVVPAELDTADQILFEDVYGGMGKGFTTRVVSYRGRRMQYRPHEAGAGCNMAFRRASLEQIGGFDPALDTGTLTGGAGDLDAFQRIAELRGLHVYRPDAAVAHRHRRTRRGLRRQLFDNGRGYAACYLTALSRARGVERLRVTRAMASWLCGWILLRLVRKATRRERLPLVLLLAELGGALAGPVCLMRSRRALRTHAIAAGVPSTSPARTSA